MPCIALWCPEAPVVSGEPKGGRFGARLLAICASGVNPQWTLVIGSPDADDGAGLVQAFAADSLSEMYRVSGSVRNSGFGEVLAKVGDVDGDGCEDFAIGSPRYSRGAGPQCGRVEVISGRVGTTIITVDGRDGGDEFGASMCGTPDMNDDGTPDLVVGAPGHRGGSGCVYLVSGHSGSLLRVLGVGQ